jgi:hypothetical protein
MTQTKNPRVEKLLPRHVEAGIEVVYDDHCVMLAHNGEPLLINPGSEYEVLAVWTGDVTIDRMISLADTWLDQRGER